MDLSKVITLDVECYENYFLVMFRKVLTGDIIHFEKFEDSDLNRKNIAHILSKYTLVTFNGNSYDMTMIECALAGFKNKVIKKCSDMIISDNMRPWQVRKQMGFPSVQADHIDLIEVAPLKANLKIYGGRVHCPTMQDLPIPPEARITKDMLPSMRKYCGNDNEVTTILLKELESEIDLRESLSKQYNVDMRSKSDAQIAEAVIKSELESKYNIKVKRPSVREGTRFRYKPPESLSFQTDILKDILKQYTSRPFTINKGGYVEYHFKIEESDRLKSGKNKGKLPEKKPQLKFRIGETDYKIGIGGIHSCEKTIRHTNKNHIIRDYDVASYYPRIILINELAPKHLGEPFLKTYESIVNRRLDAKAKQKEAKKAGDKEAEQKYKVINESLKITINGSFGKFGSKWSCLYSPDLMMQVTITGQLALLMLIERFEMNGIQVISANTDGVVTKFEPEKEEIAEEIVADWMLETGYDMESTDYASLNSRDINNYIAVGTDGSVKGKGAYVDQTDHYYKLRSNPSNAICVEAVKEFLLNGVPLEDTIKACQDIKKFVTVRTVNGGAIKDGELLGKAIRWYYGAEELDAIYYSTNGNKVPKSDGGVPVMVLPEKLPEDIDYDWYIVESKKILKEIGYKLK